MTTCIIKSGAAVSVLSLSTAVFLAGCGAGADSGADTAPTGARPVKMGGTTACSFPDYKWGTSYRTGNIVRYPSNGKFYIAEHDNPGWDPLISTYFWDPYTCTADTSGTTTGTTSGTAGTCSYPAWKWGQQYKTGDIVTYPDDGKLYVAEHDNPGWDPVISTYFWNPYTCSAPAPAPAPTDPVAPTAPALPVGTQITASSCGYSAVAAAVASAPAGSTVNIPAGDCSWGTQQLNVPGGIALRGAGQDKTVIRRVGSVPNTAYVVAFNCGNGKPARFSGMTLVGNGNGSIQDKGLGLLNGCADFRVSDSKFTKFIFSAVYVGDAPNQRGVIYKNNFIDNYSADLRNLGYGVVVYGGGAWPALSLGTANAVFVEDNYFSGNRHNIASNNGSVYVFRYNKVVGTDAAKDYAMTDAHGLSSSPRGSRSFEIYNNNYSTSISSGLQRTAIGIRGGDGVVFNNTAPATISRTVELMVEGFGCGAYPGPDQSRSVYIWNNSANPQNGYTTNGIDNTCPSSLGINRDIFLNARPGYTPYTYPHPMRAQP